MANIGIILGKSGSGKSTSLKTLNPDETVVFNVLKKRLPFKGSRELFNTEKNNFFNMDSLPDLMNYLQSISDNAPHVKTVVIDDAIYLMRKEYFKRAKEAGYTKYTELAQHFQQLISLCENMREDMNVFLLLHSEDVISDNSIIEYKVSTIGKLLDSQYNPVEVVPIVLYSSVIYDEHGKASYGFFTHRHKEGTTVIPAKSPDGMFDQDFIPNDLGAVVKAIDAYYN